MIEKRLDTILTDRGYTRKSSNASGIYLFYRIEGDNRNTGEAAELSVISVIHAIDGTELTREQYGYILEQMKNSMILTNPCRIQLLSLILTASPENARQLCIDWEEDNHWIIDVDSCHLMLYENQYDSHGLSIELQELRSKIEMLLEEELFRRQELLQTNAGPQHPIGYGEILKPRKKIRVLTPINTILILLNLLIFILTYYTPVFGGAERALASGALSWYGVTKEGEYHRLLTSMFLHADLGHLFNNMLVLFFVGDNLERAAGKLKYLIVYIGAGILAGIASISYNMWKEYGQLPGNTTFSIGASGAIFGVIGATFLIVAINRGRLEDISTRQMVLFIVFSLYGGIMNTRIDQAAHIGGFLAGLLLAAMIYRRPAKNTSGGEVTT